MNTEREPGSDDERVDTTTGEIVERVPAEQINPFANSPIVAAPTGAAAQALVQREVTEVQSAMVIAKRFPRDPKISWDRIITACTRQTLAEHALYKYARGGTDIEGPSIRLAEELARQWGNVVCGVTEIVRMAGHSECLAYAWDLETNFRDEKRFTVRHWRDTRQGGYALTDERDIYEVIANMGARRKRACILTVIPGDITEAAVTEIKRTLQTNVKITAERLKNMAEAFEKYGVTKEMLEKRAQRRWDVETITPALFVQLNSVFNSLKDGMSQAGDWFEMPGAGDQAETRTDSVRGKLAARAKGAEK